MPDIEAVILCSMPNTKKTNFTNPGSVNRNGQRVLEFIRKDKANPLTEVYAVVCTRCAYEYGAYSSDLWQRKCPKCQDGREGLAL